jgi:hypothetical protein
MHSHNLLSELADLFKGGSVCQRKDAQEAFPVPDVIVPGCSIVLWAAVPMCVVGKE